MLILTMLTLDIRTCISEYDVDGSDRRQRQTDRQTAIDSSGSNQYRILYSCDLKLGLHIRCGTGCHYILLLSVVGTAQMVVVLRGAKRVSFVCVATMCV